MSEYTKKQILLFYESFCNNCHMRTGAVEDLIPRCLPPPHSALLQNKPKVRTSCPSNAERALPCPKIPLGDLAHEKSQRLTHFLSIYWTKFLASMSCSI